MNPEHDPGHATVMVHLGAPESISVREYDGADPFVAFEVAPGVAVLSPDPEALLSFEEAVRDARLRLDGLLDAVERDSLLRADLDGLEETVEIYDPDGSVQRMFEAARTDTSAPEDPDPQAFGAGGRS